MQISLIFETNASPGLTGAELMHIFVHMNEKVHLPRREQQVMDIVFSLERAAVGDVQAQLPDQPSYSATRMLLQRLHKKGLLNVERDGKRYLYLPATTKHSAGRVALNRLMQTFFDNSATSTVSALLDREEITGAELAELEALVKAARQRRNDQT